jgi:hypothetical protein
LYSSLNEAITKPAFCKLRRCPRTPIKVAYATVIAVIEPRCASRTFDDGFSNNASYLSPIMFSFGYESPRRVIEAQYPINTMYFIRY